MKTDIHLWSYLAQLFLDWEIFQVNLYRKSKHTSDIKYISFRKNVLFMT